MFEECINSIASDDHTGMDSFHECLQEYGEGLEVVQICLEPEDSSIKDDELSALADLSLDDLKTMKSVKNKQNFEIKESEMNGEAIMKSKSEESLVDDDMTITEDDVLITPRDLPDTRSKSTDRKGEIERTLSKQQSKDISTSDEMVFAVTPTGLERISFDIYWKEDESLDCKLKKIKSDESWKECLNSPTNDCSFYDATTRISVQEENSSLLYIDHEIDGYETCLEDDSVKCSIKNDRKINGDEMKETGKQNKIANKNKDNDASAKPIRSVDEATYGHPYVHEHIIKQMQSLRIEPINVNISNKKHKRRSPNRSPKQAKTGRKCVEYYNDQDECLKEIRKKKEADEVRLKKLEEEDKKNKEDQQKLLQNNIAAMEKKLQLKKQEPSEESTDLETNYVPGCHKCFLENYAYEITKAYIAEANSCKYCEVIRDFLEAPKGMPDRRMSAPALVNMESSGSATEEDDFLMVPVVKDRRKSAGPLKFLVPSRRSR